MALFYEKKYREAEKELSEVLKTDGSYGPAYYSLGLVYDEMERLNSAVTNYQKAIRLMPLHAPSHYELGVVYFKKRSFEFALSEWEKAIELEPENYGFVHSSMGLLFEERNMPEEAWREYERALKDNPADITTLFRLGVLMMKEGFYEEALSNFNEITHLAGEGHIAEKAREYTEEIEDILEEETEEEINDEEEKENEERK